MSNESGGGEEQPLTDVQKGRPISLEFKKNVSNSKIRQPTIPLRTLNHKVALQHLYREEMMAGDYYDKRRFNGRKINYELCIDRALSLRYGQLRPTKTDPIYEKSNLTFEDESIWFERKKIGGDETNSFFHCILGYMGLWDNSNAEMNLKKGLMLRSILIDDLLNICFGVDKNTARILLIWAKGGLSDDEEGGWLPTISKTHKQALSILVREFKERCGSTPFPFVTNVPPSQQQQDRQQSKVISYSPEDGNLWGFLNFDDESHAHYRKKIANILATLWFYSEYRITRKENHSYGTLKFIVEMLDYLLDSYVVEKNIDVNIMMKLYSEKKGLSIYIFGIDHNTQSLKLVAKYIPVYKNNKCRCNLYLVYYDGRYDLLGPVLSKKCSKRFEILEKRESNESRDQLPTLLSTAEILKIREYEEEIVKRSRSSRVKVTCESISNDDENCSRNVVVQEERKEEKESEVSQVEVVTNVGVIGGKKLNLGLLNIDGLTFREAVLRFYAKNTVTNDYDIVDDYSSSVTNDEKESRGEILNIGNSLLGATMGFLASGVSNIGDSYKRTPACVYTVNFDSEIDDVKHQHCSRTQSTTALKMRFRGSLINSFNGGRPGPFYKSNIAELTWSKVAVRVISLGHILELKPKDTVHSGGVVGGDSDVTFGSLFLSIKVSRNDKLQANIIDPVSGTSLLLGECVEISNEYMKASFLVILIEGLQKEFYFHDSTHKGIEHNAWCFYGNDVATQKEVNDSKYHNLIHSIDCVPFSCVPNGKRKVSFLADLQTKKISPVEAIGFINRTNISCLDLNNYRISGIGLIDQRKYNSGARNPFTRYSSIRWKNVKTEKRQEQQSNEENEQYQRREQSINDNFSINLSFYLPKDCCAMVLYSKEPLITLDPRKKGTNAYHVIKSNYAKKRKQNESREVSDAEILSFLMTLNEDNTLDNEQEKLWRSGLLSRILLNQEKKDSLKIVGYKESGSAEALIATIDSSPVGTENMFGFEEHQSYCKLDGYLYIITTHDVSPSMYSGLLKVKKTTKEPEPQVIVDCSEENRDYKNISMHVNKKTKKFYANSIKFFI